MGKLVRLAIGLEGFALGRSASDALHNGLKQNAIGMQQAGVSFEDWKSESKVGIAMLPDRPGKTLKWCPGADLNRKPID